MIINVFPIEGIPFNEKVASPSLILLLSAVIGLNRRFAEPNALISVTFTVMSVASARPPASVAVRVNE